jgi:hypothetical protein
VTAATGEREEANGSSESNESKDPMKRSAEATKKRDCPWSSDL